MGCALFCMWLFRDVHLLSSFHVAQLFGFDRAALPIGILLLSYCRVRMIPPAHAIEFVIDHINLFVCSNDMCECSQRMGQRNAILTPHLERWRCVQRTKMFVCVRRAARKRARRIRIQCESNEKCSSVRWHNIGPAFLPWNFIRSDSAENCVCLRSSQIKCMHRHTTHTHTYILWYCNNYLSFVSSAGETLVCQSSNWHIIK